MTLEDQFSSKNEMAGLMILASGPDWRFANQEAFNCGCVNLCSLLNEKVPSMMETVTLLGNGGAKLGVTIIVE